MTQNLTRELISILSLSFSFIFIFAAYLTFGNIKEIIVSSVNDERPDFSVDGYSVTGLEYTCFAVSLWFGPYITYTLGAKNTMIIASIGYLCQVSAFIFETVWVIYVGATIGGLSAGLLWPAQGHYMIESSTPKTTARNVGIFFFLFMTSDLFGNLFVYFTFQGKKYIDQPTRRTLLGVLAVINTVGVLTLLLLPKTPTTHRPNEVGPIKTMRQSWKIMLSNRMMWLTPASCYAGLQQSFWSGIYGPSVGFTLAFGDTAKQLVGLSGMFMSVGGLLGALCPIVLSKWISSHSHSRRLLFMAGCIGQLVAYLITFINLPDASVFGNTEDLSFIQPNPVLAMVGSVLLKFGDASINTQVYGFIGDFYKDSSAEACALYKFFKAVFVAVSFYLCNHLGLHTQLALTGAMAVIGCTSFWIADIAPTI